MTATDGSGNTLTATSAPASYTVESAPTITVSAPDVTTVNESGNLSITGVTTGATPGNTVTVTLADGVTYSGTVSQDGTFTISNVPASDLINNAAHTLTATLVAIDSSQNSLSVTSAPASYLVDINPTVSITATVGDNNDVTWAEQGINAHGHSDNDGDDGTRSLQVQGQVSGAFSAGDTVTVSIGTSSYTTTVKADGSYSVNVDASVLTSNTSVTATVAAHDSSGSLQDASVTQAYSVDAVPTLTVNIPSGNDLTWAEQSSGGQVAVTGQVSGTFTDGDTVTLKVGGNTYSGTVNSNGSYSINVDESALANHDSIKATLNATDSAGQSISVSQNQPYTVDVAPSISVSDINWEDGSATVSGHVHGTYSQGDVVTVMVGGSQFTGNVNQDGSFSVSVSQSALGSSGTVTASITATDSAGQTTTAESNPKSYHHDSSFDSSASSSGQNGDGGVDQGGGQSGNIQTGDSSSQSGASGENNGDNSGTASTPPAISVDAVNGSGVIDIGRESTNASIAITGTVTGTFLANDSVTLSVGNTTIGTGQVDASGHYSITVSASSLEGATSVTASVLAHDASGNGTTATSTQAYTVEAMPQITVDGLNSSYVVNIADESANATVNVTGTVSGTYQQGDQVTLTVGTGSYTGSVDSTGHYSIGVSASALESANSITASVTAHDSSNNAATVSASQAYSVEALPQITGLIVGGNNEITVGDQHSNHAVAVSGTVTGTFEAGDMVTLEVGSNSFTGTVGSDGSFSISVSAHDLAGASSVTASVTASDSTGHTATATQSDSYVVDPLPGNSQGQGHGQAGTNSNSIQSVSLSTEGNSPGGGSGSSGSSDSGNSTVSTPPAISVDAVNGSGVIDIGRESANASIDITGTVTGTFQANDSVTLTAGNAVIGTGSVDASGHYSIAVSASNLEGTASVTAAVLAHDASGNGTTATSTQSYTVEAMPQITVDGLNSSYVVNIADESANATVNVTGTVSGTYQQGDEVTLTVGSGAYTGSVDSTGHYSIGVSASALESANSITASVTAHDSSNNAATVSASQAYSVEALPQITGLTVGGSNEITVGQQQSNDSVAVNGTVTGTFEAGDKVTLEVGSNSFTGTVGSDGSFSISVSAHDLAGASSVTASVTASDSTGHTATATQSDSYVVDPVPVQTQDQSQGQVLQSQDQGTSNQTQSQQGIVSGTSSGSDLSGLISSQHDAALNVPTNGGQGAGSSSTLNINDVVSPSSGDLLQNLAVAGPGSSGAADSSASAAGSSLVTPPITPDTTNGSALMDPELLKSIVAAVTPPPPPGHH
ncbi:MAG: Ig-like domain-containing protein [Betaproteobacteria bacterium]|nr:Ig-like domain-containing protein [Betaproteobacteria bacterium]